MSFYNQQNFSRISDIKPHPRPQILQRSKIISEKTQENHIFHPPYVSTSNTEQKNFHRYKHTNKLEFVSMFWHLVGRLWNPRVIFFLVFVSVGLAVWGGWTVFAVKKEMLKEGERGFKNLALAVEDVKEENFAKSFDHFGEAQKAFARGKSYFPWGSGAFVGITRFVPGLSQAASGKYALEAGESFALAGASLVKVAEEFSLSKDAYAQGEKISLLDFLARIEKELKQSALELNAGNLALEKININDIPEEKRGVFLLARQNIPTFIGLIGKFEQYETLLSELLGGRGPRKYLFLLQNNHELRATGGFIGSYALLDVNNGAVRNFFVDGIFNPDGQLKENIVPPQPIQKISAAWSLHDSNWFPDFPVSAEKAIFFYEKTGGPTVDGVITLTPTIMQKLLAVVGPIDLPQYGFSVDANNFITVIQEQVEVKYDREENQPKKVLADLSVLLFEKIFVIQDKSVLYKIAEALNEGLNEKQMLIYMRHPETEALIDKAGWSGRVLTSSKDYISVIHTNINGYKTDGVIDETIKHKAEISSDGSIINTLTITRTHRGGQTPYDWWNRVNADYLRVYVPQGSKLLSAKGMTWEFSDAPLDYQALGFRRDADVEREENLIAVDEKSGTRVYEDAGKAVFGAWVYVSPQESVTVEYRYLLPFSIDMSKLEKGDADSYFIIYQKQSGSMGSKLFSSVIFPEKMRMIWQDSGNLLSSEREWKLETDLKTDVFAGMVFGAAQQ